MMSPWTGMIVPSGPALAVSCRVSSRRPMMKTLEAPLAARACAIIFPRPE